MTTENGHRPLDRLLTALTERAKELNCLYEVEQNLGNNERPLDESMQAVVDAIPPGWQYPEICRAKIEIGDQDFRSDGFRATLWMQSAEIEVQDESLGQVLVAYAEQRPNEDSGPFLKEEERLIQTIAERVGHFILFQRLQNVREELTHAQLETVDNGRGRWHGPIDLLRRSDRDLYLRVSRKMVNHLCWAGVDGAQDLLKETFGDVDDADVVSDDSNVPRRAFALDESVLLSNRPFELAAENLGDDQVLDLVQDWIVEEKIGFFPKVLNNPLSTLPEVADAVRRFHHLISDGTQLAQSTIDGLLVSLIRRFFTEQLGTITIAKEYLEISDFLALLDSVILSSDSLGKLGGKTSGLLLAEKVLRSAIVDGEPIGDFKVPRSWFVAAEELVAFVQYNDLEEVLQQKYREIEQVRHEYSNIVKLFKGSRFPPDIVHGLSNLLDEVGEKPLIVRSSSILEDRLGSAFAGKYKSLFLANQGDKKDRLHSLLDAITEVYASMFGPDPIAYRREKNLQDFHEEMAILIQEVVGANAGSYYFPAAAGVAFSSNQFRWSSRIRREDGLVRIVPGLGTRAVDRLGSDYPVLAVPGKPNLRVNTTVEEITRYSPHEIDVLNLENNAFETLPIADLLAEVGSRYPAFNLVFSNMRDGSLQRIVGNIVDPDAEIVADFDGLFSRSKILGQIGAMLRTLEEALGTPVDIEFAFDGTDLYLLQCRPQSFAAEDSPAPIPKDIPPEDVVFHANRYITNGWVPDITHIVYVDPGAYGELEERTTMLMVARAVGHLNKLLPKRKFILMGPGRWGSRGDVQLGVGVSYSDINNSAMLIEIARAKGSYVPDVSFGTHFFQDLVESSIRYLPVYPDDEGQVLNDRFLMRAPNLLREIAPKYGDLEHVIRAIDVTLTTRGRVLRVLMNAELEEAVGMLARPDDERDLPKPAPAESEGRERSETFWRWRMHMAERIADEIDPERFGVEALYIIGSTKNANAGPSSDIDFIVHFRGTDEQRQDLEVWLDGWSLSLGEMNYLRTGYKTGGLLDVHIVTDEDIEKGSSFAAKINAVTDPALELPIGKRNS